MGINLTGFATGFAKTLATRIEDEREKEEKILSNRFNLAASNRLTRQKEADELRKVYESRVKNFSSAYPMASEEQIAAAISTETNYNTLMKAHEEGFSVDEKVDVLDKYVTVGKMPETFTTAMGLVQQTIQPQVGTVDGSERQTKKLLGFFDVSPGEEKRQQYADQYGVDAKELDAYAEGAVTIPDLGAMGSVSSAFLKSPETLPQKIDKLRINLFEAKKSEDPEAIERAENLVAAAVASQTFSGEYDPDKELKKMKGTAMQLNAKSNKTVMEVAELKSLEKQITYIENLGKKETRSESATATVTLAGLLRRTVTNVAADLMPVGSFTISSSGELLPTDMVKSEAFVASKKKGFEQALAILVSKGMVNANGMFTDSVAKEAWLASGGQISEDGKALVPSLAPVLQGSGDGAGTSPPAAAGGRTGQTKAAPTPEATDQASFDALWKAAKAGDKVKGPNGKIYIKP